MSSRWTTTPLSTRGDSTPGPACWRTRCRATMKRSMAWWIACASGSPTSSWRTLALASTPPWCVLEYAAPDARRAYAGLFRLTGSGEPVHHFYPRGLDPRRVYRVTCDNSGITEEFPGRQLQQEGLRVRLESALTS